MRSIVSYIGRDNLHAARRVRLRIEEVVSKLAQMPVGRRGRMIGTYEMIVTGLPYIVCYRVNDSFLDVTRVIHGARNWTAGRWPEE